MEDMEELFQLHRGNITVNSTTVPTGSTYPLPIADTAIPGLTPPATGATITLTISPDQGYELKELKVLKNLENPFNLEGIVV